MIIRIKCVDCGKIYNRDEEGWIVQTGSSITTYTCPDCGSDNFIKADTSWEEN